MLLRIFEFGLEHCFGLSISVSLFILFMSAENKDTFAFAKELRYDFGTNEHAAIAARTLSVDDDLKPNESVSTFSADNGFLVFSVRAISEKHLQKAISTTQPSIDLIRQTIEEFAKDRQ